MTVFSKVPPRKTSYLEGTKLTVQIWKSSPSGQGAKELKMRAGRELLAEPSR